MQQDEKCIFKWLGVGLIDSKFWFEHMELLLLLFYFFFFCELHNVNRKQRAGYSLGSG